jgi:lipopolysaccharide biosynthesis glycosyltransferase
MMKHFFALYKDPAGQYLNYVDHIKAMINSAQQNTSLQSYFIYDGEPDELTDWLEKRGVTVLYHRSSLADRIQASTGERFNKHTAMGAYLRLDIPLLLQQLAITDDLVLYTDCDVVFLKEVTYSALPRYFAIAPEFNSRPERPNFNTGIMFINTADFSSSHEQLMHFVRQAGDISSFGDYDQGVVNSFYKDRFSLLEWNYNWRPYFGINPDAVIVHYHGLKIKDITEAIRQNGHEAPIFNQLYNSNPKAYHHYHELFVAFLQQ